LYSLPVLSPRGSARPYSHDIANRLASAWLCGARSELGSSGFSDRCSVGDAQGRYDDDAKKIHLTGRRQVATCQVFPPSPRDQSIHCWAGHEEQYNCQCDAYRPPGQGGSMIKRYSWLDPRPAS